MATGPFLNEKHALASAVLLELFKRVKQECRDSLRARKKGVHTDIPKDGAQRTLKSLPLLQKRISDQSPTWEYLHQVLMLAEAFPPQRTRTRLVSRTKRRAAKQPRPNSLIAQIRKMHIKTYVEFRKKAPKLAAKHDKAIVMQAISRAIRTKK